jgi:hypothetical protein
VAVTSCTAVASKQMVSADALVRTLTVTATCGAGDLVVLATAYGSQSGTSTIADSQSNTWASGTRFPGTGYGGSLQIFWSVLTTPLVSGVDSVQLTPSGSRQDTIDVYRAVSDVGWPATALVKDVEVGQAPSTGSTSPATGNSAASSFADLLVAFTGWTDTSSTFTAGGGFTVSPTGVLRGGAKSGEGEYELSSPAGAQAATGTLSASIGWSMALVAFRENAASASAPAVFIPRRMPLGV